MPLGAILPLLTKDAPFSNADYERRGFSEGRRGFEKGEHLYDGVGGEVALIAG